MCPHTLFGVSRLLRWRIIKRSADEVTNKRLSGVRDRLAAYTMYEEHTIGVVVPAYNEEGYVGDVVDSIPEFVDRIYVIDDASTDGTWGEIRERAAAYNERRPSVVPRFERRVVPIQHDENRGAGGAIKTGYLAAREDRIDVTVTIDADGQMDTELLPRFLDPIVEDRADYAKGNRFIARDLDSMPRFRLIGNSILSLLTKIASGYWKTSDPQNGYTAISLRALDGMDLDGMYEYYGYCNDVLVKLNVAGMRVADVAQPAVYAEEESHIDYTEYIPKVSGMLLRNFVWRLNRKYLVRDFHPLALCYYAGAGALGVSLVGLLASLRSRRAATGSWFASAVLGVALLLLAMVFDMEESRDLEEQIIEDDEEVDSDSFSASVSDRTVNSAASVDDD